MSLAQPALLGTTARHVIPFRALPHRASGKARPSRRTTSRPMLCNQRHHRIMAQAAQSAGSAGEQPPLPVVVPDTVIDPDGHVEQQPVLTPEQRRQLWKTTINAPLYSVGILPVLVSAAAVFLQINHYDLARTGLLCIASTCIVAWLSFTNEVYEPHSGVDSGSYKPGSIVSVAGSRLNAFLIAHALLAVGGFILYKLVGTMANPLAGKMLAAAVGLGYLYQGPPFRLSYLGIGEPMCFAAFGPLATCAFYLALAPTATLNPMIIGLSILVGISTTVVLFSSHFHKVEGDRAQHKMSPVVRLGGEKATEVLKFAVGLTHALALGMSLFGVLPLACWTSVMVSYGYANKMVKFAEAHWEEPDQVEPLTDYAIRWHIGFCCMLVMGLLLQKII